MSTGEAVFDFVNNLFRYRDIGYYTAATFVDMRKAFDSIHHGILLKKMSKLGIHLDFLSWVESYLKLRLQYTEIDGISSTKDM